MAGSSWSLFDSVISSWSFNDYANYILLPMLLVILYFYLEHIRDPELLRREHERTLALAEQLRRRTVAARIGLRFDDDFPTVRRRTRHRRKQTPKQK